MHDSLQQTPSLISIGYEGRDVDQLIWTLKNWNVQVLVDVRLTPISRKKGMSKSALREALQTAGIGYVHHRELGNPKDNRDGFRLGTKTSHDRFRAILDQAEAEGALRHVTELLDEGTVALLCFERDHAQCHREIVADAICRDHEVSLICV